MGRPRIYATAAERQRAYRQRQPTKLSRDALCEELYLLLGEITKRRQKAKVHREARHSNLDQPKVIELLNFIEYRIHVVADGNITGR